MKDVFMIIFIFLLGMSCHAQKVYKTSEIKCKNILTMTLFAFSSVCFCQEDLMQLEVSETYSENGQYLIKSYAYEADSYTMRGKSIVSHKGKERYTINQYLGGNKIIISNDGKTIIDFESNPEYFQYDDVKNVSIYRSGKLVQEFDEFEFTGCNAEDFVYDEFLMNENPCHLFYYNKDIFDREKTEYGNWILKEDSKGRRILREGLEDEDLFLYHNYAFSQNDTVYLIDKRKIVTLYDLNHLKIIGHKRFEEIYPKIKDYKKQKSKISYLKYPYKDIFDLSDQRTQEKLSDFIGRISNAKTTSFDTDESKFKLYFIQLSGYLYRNGKFEIDFIICDEELKEKEIVNYLQKNKFNSDFIPKELDKIYLSINSRSYRNPVDSLAEFELIQFRKKQTIDRQKRLTLDSINKIYIPKNLKDCFSQLDEILTIKDKEIIKRTVTDDLHFSLGLWIRNNWGIWGGSRIEKYFRDRRPKMQPDDISSHILNAYNEWLHGNLNVAEEWEKENPIVIKVSN